MLDTFFRHEYFGGVLYSQKIPGLVPIEEPHWSLVTAAVTFTGAEGLRAALARPDAETLRAVVARCARLGAIDDAGRVTCEVFRAPYPLVRGVLSGPIRAYLHITGRCNLKCAHCMFACGRGRASTPEMSRAELRRLLEVLRDVRCPELRITGGEPTVRPDLPAFMAEARQMGFYVMLNTNGVFGDATCDRLLDADPHELIVSLDGTPGRHDALRGAGAFDRLDRNLVVLAARRDAGNGSPVLTLNFTFGRHNADDLEWVVGFAARRRIHVNLMPLRPFGAARCNLMADMLTPAEFTAFTAWVDRLRADEQVRAAGIRIIHKNFDLNAPAGDARGVPPPFDRSSCGACSFGLGINPDGRANACGFLAGDPRFVGPNLLQVPFERVWYAPAIHAFRTVVKVPCEGCRHYRRACVGACKAMALATADGDWDGLSDNDPYCPGGCPDDEAVTIGSDRSDEANP